MTDSGSRPVSAEPDAQVGFRNPNIAAQNLARIRERVPAALLGPLLQLLTESPDPDAALNLFERLTATAGLEVFRQLERHPILLHYAVVIFGYSNYLGETLLQNPDLFHVLLREKNLHLTHSRDEYAEILARFRSRSLEGDISLLLARFKRREYVRIMLRDVLRMATLAETTAEISALADVLIEEALRDADMRLRNRYGAPQTLDRDGRLVVVPFAVLSLGKLGGNELNYSSDIDLLFLHGDGEAPPEAAISNHEYFVRLAQQVTENLSRVTRDGAPFRIDLRLRPQGGEGEPTVGISHALDYYAHRASDWELQAMIKLRHSAGNQALAREFIRRAQPFVYTEQLNFAAIETATQARERIGTRRRAASHGVPHIDVKLDRGGIRDIEFLVQCLQRVYGGTELWLRSGGTLFSLQKLHDKGHISGKEFQDLTTAYEFLRTLEHRLQLRYGQQTHRLPANAHALQVLARMMIPLPGDIPTQTTSDRVHGAAASGEESGSTANDDATEIVGVVRRRMAAVAEIYTRIIHQKQVHQHDVPEFHLRSLGDSRDNGHRQLLERLAIDAPAIHELAHRTDLDSHARRNLYRFLDAAFTSSERYAIVAHAPEAMQRAVEVLAVSDYLTDLLIRHPEHIATLQEIPVAEPSPSTGVKTPAACRARVESDPLFATDEETGAGGTDPIFTYVASGTGSYSEKMALLRQHYQERLLASGTRDVMEGRSVWDALAETTAAADQAIGAALAVAEGPAGFAVLALGRLGTSEHDLLSDADLLFVRNETADARDTRRTAERMVEVLSAYTRDGAVFPVDARLRPHGGEGELVITPAQLEAYGMREAQPWEALTYTKLRCVAGDRGVAAQAVAAADRFMRRFAKDDAFPASVREMRARLEKADVERDNLKTGPGGLYDIDFLVGSRLVLHGIGETRGNLRQRLASLRDRGLLEPEDAGRLQHHAELLRTVEHAIRLVTGRARKTLPVAGPSLAACEQLCATMLGREFPEGLAITLRFALVGVREIFERALKSN